jgi:UDP-2,4-diacetamido-2,4,6-trideoxy-beta-L-altropyranose hydrolase
MGRQRDPTPHLSLRPATAEDAGFLLELRNEPGTRSFSFSGGHVSVAEHRDWLAARLADAGTLLWIASVDGHRVGQVRLSRLDTRTAEIHIAVVPSSRGVGVGRLIIQRAAERCSASWPEVSRLRARVMRHNAASLRAFRAAGFTELRRPTGDAEVVLEHKLRPGAAADGR